MRYFKFYFLFKKIMRNLIKSKLIFKKELCYLNQLPCIQNVKNPNVTTSRRI